jgi:hypothetical protein
VVGPAPTLEQAVFGGSARVLGNDVLGGEPGWAGAAPDAEDGGGAAVPPSEAAWHDSDDEGLSVDVVANPRSRKLRVDEEERVLKGDVYESRLKTQFEKVHGRPAWADAAAAVDEDGQPGVLGTTSKLLGKHSCPLSLPLTRSLSPPCGCHRASPRPSSSTTCHHATQHTTHKGNRSVITKYSNFFPKGHGAPLRVRLVFV